MRRILSIAWVYQFYQWLVGAHKYVRLFADEYIKYKDGQKILDIGCGPADIIKYLAANVDYTGIDLSPQYINKFCRFCRKKYLHRKSTRFSTSYSPNIV